MKTKFLKIFAIIFSVALLLTGCATVSDVYDKNGNPIYFEEVVHFGGQVAKIGDYLYYANGYTDASGDSFDYDQAAETGYLARINLNKDFTFDANVADEDKKDTSPENIEKVSDRFVGYQNQDMFALGSYLYFSSTNTHKTSSLENDYSRVTLFRVAFNGDNLKEIYTTRYDDKSEITVQKGSDGEYYYIICAQNGDEEYELSSIKIGDNLGSRTILVENVESFVMPDENSTVKEVLYTATNDDGEIEIRSIDFANKKTKDFSYSTNMEISLLERCGDVVFYSADKKNADVEVFYKDISLTDNHFDGDTRFYSADSISNVIKVDEGYCFISSTGALIYKTLNGSSKKILSADDSFEILFEKNGWIYYSTATEINRISVIDLSKENLITMTDIVSGSYGFSDGYLYFFAKLENQDTDETDDNYYLYRVDNAGTQNYQLIGKTK